MVEMVEEVEIELHEVLLHIAVDEVVEVVVDSEHETVEMVEMHEIILVEVVEELVEMHEYSEHDELVEEVVYLLDLNDEIDGFDEMVDLE
jgi:hypothetical protein